VTRRGYVVAALACLAIETVAIVVALATHNVHAGVPIAAVVSVIGAVTLLRRNRKR
jgi:hypothetical protein